MTTLADEIARVLAANGVSRLFGIPGGGSSLDLIDAAAKADIPFVLARTEAAAAIMAAVTGELSGAPGAVLVGVGPGASSAVNGIAYASLERSPMVLFADGPASSLHQHFDQQGIYRPLARGTAHLGPDGGAEQLDKLLKTAARAPEGPVMVEMTAGDAAAAAGPSFAATPSPAAPAPTTDAVDTAKRLLEGSRKPIVVAGLEARRHAKRLRRFADGIGAAVMTTYKAAGVYPATAPTFVGSVTGAAGEMPVLAKADLIVAAGFDPIEFIPGAWPANMPPVLHLTDGAPANPRVPVEMRLQGPLDAILDTLTPTHHGDGWDDGEIAALRARIRAIYEPTGSTFGCASAVETMAGALPTTTRLAVDAGAHMFAVFGLWPATEPFGALKSNGLSTMGYALPAAIASKLADPATDVVAVTGDGGLSMCLAELATAKELNLDITVCVMNDAALSLIDVKQQRQQRPSLGVRYPLIDYADVAAAFGWAAYRAETADAFADALARPGRKLIDVRVDPASYGDDLQRLRG